MDPRHLDGRVSASPQLNPEDLSIAHGLGYRSIIVNRPDDEEPYQPTIERMRRAAEEAGLGFSAIPVVPGGATGADASAFRAALDDLPGPVLAYCRTGTRAATLWAMSEAVMRDPAELVAAAASAGYDISALSPVLSDLHRSDEA